MKLPATLLSLTFLSGFACVVPVTTATVCAAQNQAPQTPPQQDPAATTPVAPASATPAGTAPATSAPGTPAPGIPAPGTPAPAASADLSAPATTDPAMPMAPAPMSSGLVAAPAADSYVIGASDVLAVTVWKEPALSGSILVRPDGMISMPLLGDVQASGLTPLQLAAQVAIKLKKYIQDPNVSVVVSAIHSKVIYLLGEVAKKGPIEMMPGMTVLRAIASAGGLTDYANTKKIYILRDVDGKHTKIPVSYKAALKGNADLDLVLQSGDTVIVP